MSTLLAAFVLLMGGGLSAIADPELPNIVVILSDDYGYGSAGCYGADGKLIRTPAIDRLAAEGRRFTDANTTSSVCSPTRYSVLTGRYCWRTSLQSGVLSTFSPLHIEPTRFNLASLLKEHGYRTAAVGKWHLGYGTGDGTPKWRTDYMAELTPGPLDIGFDYHFAVPSNHGDLTGVYVQDRFVYGLRSGKIPPEMRLPGPAPDDDNFKATYTRDDTESKKNDPMDLDAPRRVNERVMPLLTEKAVRWIEAQKGKGPFFLYFTPVAVHNPVTPDKDLAGKSAAGPYGDWIHELDRSVGGILDSLDKQGVAKNTLVIFSSDNGGVKRPERTDMPQTQALNAGLAVNGPLRGGKHDVWEGGFKVPFIVRWPGRAPAGTVCDAMVSLADIVATAAAIVGEPLPAPGTGAEDSHSFLPAILGEPGAKPARPDMIVHSSDGVFAIRKGPWKWIEGVPAAGVRRTQSDEFRAQLYNIKEDLAETKDVSGEHAEVVKELEGLLERYRNGGYSRELPPVSARADASKALPPLTGGVVFSDVLAAIPGEPWVQVRGKWVARDNAVWASQKGGEQQPAALRHPLEMADGAIQYEISLPSAGSHGLRLQCADKDAVFRVEVSARALSIVGPTGIIAREAIRLAPDTWHTVRVTLAGQEIRAQIGDITVRAVNDALGQKKTSFALMANGQSIGFRKLVVALRAD